MWRTFRLARQSLTLNKEYAGIRIQGGRHYQEDDFGFDSSKPNDFMMILADGMGGHQGGAHASHCAVKTFMDVYHESQGSVTRRLRKALKKANQQLALEAKDQPKLEGMGCTLVGVALPNYDRLEWISVGDSPLWLYNAGRLYRLNEDHSMKPVLEEQVRCGELTPEAAAKHSDRNMLRSALTGTDIEMVDQSSVELFPGDKILLASDGILTLSELEIAQILQTDRSAKKLVKALLNAVVKKGKHYQDNTTALVVKIPNELEAEENQKQPQILWRWQTIILLLLFILSLTLWTRVQSQMIDLSTIIPPDSQTLETEKVEQSLTVSHDGQHSEKLTPKIHKLTQP